MFADYFSRNATAAAQLLNNLDEDAFKNILAQVRPAISWDESATRSTEGLATLDLLVRLMSRLYPELTLLALDEGAKSIFHRLKSLAESINPNIKIGRSRARATTALVVGRSEMASSKLEPLYLGSEGWIVKLSRSSPTRSGRSRNPFGAGLAACLGAANVFREAFALQLGRPELDRELRFSVLRPNDREIKLFNPRFGKRNVGQVHLVGLGAIGNAVVWALKATPATGTFHLIDPQIIELSNLQRYVMGLRSDEHASKTVTAERELKAPGREIKTHTCSWAEYLGTVTDWRLDQVLVALDTASDRMDLQASLPQWIVNGWTRTGEAGCSVHDGIEGDHACLACLYLPEGEVPSEDLVIAAALGIEDVREVRRRLDVGVLNDETLLAQIASNKSIALDRLLPYVGKSLRTLYSEGVCGGKVVEFTQGQQRLVGEVPMAFQSAYSGIMVAAELFARDLDRHGVANLTQVDLLRPFPDIPQQWRRKKLASRCICQDTDFLQRYREKYECVAA